MPALLKGTAYRAQLAVFLAINLVICGLTLSGVDLLAANWRAIFTDLAGAIPPGLGFVAVGAINAFLSADWKARLVFLRWHHPLPGSRAFSELLTSDGRIDVKKLTAKHSPLPTVPTEQNALWYKLYRSVSGLPEVTHVHRDFLLNRDLAVMSILLLVIVAPLSATFAIKPALVLAAVYAGEFLLFRLAASNYGRRLVTTVLAIKSTQR
jgi:hypothetical protein